ncbi:MAG: alcohol dehydrogenase catalytic domain-containing protein, partial [Pseudomonadota bacterium]
MTDQPKPMSAVVLMGHGGPEMLEYRTDWPVPQPGPGQVLIKVGACGMNNTDVNTRSAWYSKGVDGATTGEASDTADDEDSSWGGASIIFPRIQGADVAGKVVAIGDGADPSFIGKRVIIDTWLRDWDDPLNLAKCGYFGSEADGGFAEFTVVDQRHVHTVDSALSDAELATFPTAYITAENMLNRAAVAAGDTVL